LSGNGQPKEKVMAKARAAKRRRSPNWDPLPLEDRGSETLLTPAEAANYLGVPERWMRAALGRREIPYCKIGGRNRFRKADLDTYIESRVIPAKEQS
jgi:excisionase family DNA binding protein